MEPFKTILDALPKVDRAQVVAGVLRAQSLQEHLKKDGIDCPDEIASAIALLTEENTVYLSKLLFNLIFGAASVKEQIEEGWIATDWLSNLDLNEAESLLCWFVRNAKR